MEIQGEGKTVTILAALLCDDVRREISGKDIIIGVYADAVFVTIIPIQLMFTIYMRLMLHDSDELSVKFRVVGPSESQVTPEVASKISGVPDPTSSVTMVLGGIQFQAQSYGRYKFEWQLPGQSWTEIAKMDLKKGQLQPQTFIPMTASIVSPPPS